MKADELIEIRIFFKREAPAMKSLRLTSLHTQDCSPHWPSPGSRGAYCSAPPLSTGHTEGVWE